MLMSSKLMVALLATLIAGGAGLALAAENPAEAPNPNDPTVSQVYDAVKAGHLEEAHQMITQVMTNHPHSARAHYVAAEIDAEMKNYGEARDELSTAEQIDPGLPNVSPRSLSELRQKIGAPAPTPSQAEAPSAGQPAARPMVVPVRQAQKPFPWATVLIIAAVVLFVWALFRRRQRPAYNPYPGGGMPSTGMGPGPMVPPAGGFPNVVGGAGPGIVGGIASGLAVGAGVAAGEELVRHAFEHGGSNVVPERYEPEVQPQPDPNADLGGPDFGINDPNSGWDDGGSSGGGDDGGWT
jgi:hypothetical protein